MRRLSKQQYINKNVNVKNFKSLEQMNMIINIIIPKFLSYFGTKHKKIWQSKLNFILPKNISDLKILWLLSKKFNCKEIEKIILFKSLIIKKR